MCVSFIFKSVSLKRGSCQIIKLLYVKMTIYYATFLDDGSHDHSITSMNRKYLDFINNCNIYNIDICYCNIS